MSGWVVPAGYRVYPPKVNMYRETVERALDAGHGERIALRFDGGEWTYQHLHREAGAVAAGLAAQGVTRGTPVLLRSPNMPQLCATLLALFKLGALPVLTNSLLKEDELEYIRGNSEARVAVTTSALAAPLRALQTRGAIDKLIFLDASDPADGAACYRDLAASTSAAPTAETDALEPGLLLYSSGTTGRPKGIVHGHRWIITMGDIIRLQMEYAPGDVVMTPGEYSFMATWGHCLMTPLASGATVALFSGRPSPESVLRAIAQYGVTKFMSVPTFYRTALAQSDIVALHDVSGVKLWMSGGEALGETPVEAWRALVGQPLNDMYGISEAQVLIGNGPANPIKPGSLGNAFPGLKLALLDDALREVATGMPGRLMVHRSDPGMFLTYHRQWDKWRNAHKGDWYDTGDVMHVDEGGYFWYHGRQDDLFKTRGMFVSPQEIEDALLKHPAVAEAAVVGAKDARIGNRVCGFLVLKPGGQPSPSLETEILDVARRHLADYKVPQELHFRDALPKSVVGKILRRGLLPGT